MGVSTQNRSRPNKVFRPLAHPHGAVFAAGDFSTLGAMQAARRHGLRVPEDMASAGFSNGAFTLAAELTITIVDQRCEEMGQAAVRLLPEGIESKGEAFAPGRWCCGPSCWCAAPRCGPCPQRCPKKGGGRRAKSIG